MCVIEMNKNHLPDESFVYECVGACSFRSRFQLIFQPLKTTRRAHGWLDSPRKHTHTYTSDVCLTAGWLGAIQWVQLEFSETDNVGHRVCSVEKDKRRLKCTGGAKEKVVGLCTGQTRRRENEERSFAHT